MADGLTRAAVMAVATGVVAAVVAAGCAHRAAPAPEPAAVAETAPAGIAESPAPAGYQTPSADRFGPVDRSPAQRRDLVEPPAPIRGVVE
jgi:hypothetical protein